MTNKKTCNKRSDLGLLILRLCLGSFLIFQGYPKLLSGPPGWNDVGATMELLGINNNLEIYGLVLATTETIGGIMLILGFYTSACCSLLSVIMLLEASNQLANTSNLNTLLLPLTHFFTLLALTLTGPGRASIDALRKKYT